jgi:hypothetical protein
MKEIKIIIEGDDSQLVDAIIDELNSHLSGTANQITFTNAALTPGFCVSMLQDSDIKDLSVTFDKVITK